jgi:hypothetical protein
MQGKAKERWMEFCERAAVEQDSDKLMLLIKENNPCSKKKNAA